jgi:hypothetical protein
VPERQRIRIPSRSRAGRAFIRTRGLVLMLRTYWARSPKPALSQKVSPCKPLATGTRRGRAVRRPIVSSSAYVGGASPSSSSLRTKRLIARFWITSSHRTAEHHGASRYLSALPSRSERHELLSNAKDDARAQPRIGTLATSPKQSRPPAGRNDESGRGVQPTRV